MKLRFTLLILLAFVLTTCKKDHLFDCFKSAGSTTTESRSATPFDYINLTNNVDLIIHPDTTPYIIVTAGGNLIDGIITELSGNTLYIRNENRCNWMRSFDNKYTVEVGMNRPVTITYDGSGDISCTDTIRSDIFTFDCYGGSGSINFIFNCNKIHLNNHIGRTDIHATGKVNESYFSINDVGTLDVTGMVAYYTYIRQSSTGDCKLNVSHELGIEILYVGNIYYTGNPAITTKIITGSGKLIPL